MAPTEMSGLSYFTRKTEFSEKRNRVKIDEEIKQSKFRSDFQKVVINLMYTSNWLATRQEEFFKPYGITVSQFNILRILRGQGMQSLSGTELKSRMLERNSDVSRLLDRLARKGLIVRTKSSSDKRAVDVRISRKGLSVLSSIDQQIDQMEKQLFKISRQEAKQLSQLLDKARG